MKKRVLSFLCSMAILCTVSAMSVLDVNAVEAEQKIVDGSALTLEDSSTGYSSSSLAKGEYLMTGDCTVSKAGLTRVYAYGSTTANEVVEYIAVLVYVERYIEEADAWGYVDSWLEATNNDYFVSTGKSVKVDRGYYYRVRANHIAGESVDSYDETASVTDGIYLP